MMYVKRCAVAATLLSTELFLLSSVGSMQVGMILGASMEHASAAEPQFVTYLLFSIPIGEQWKSVKYAVTI